MSNLGKNWKMRDLSISVCAAHLYIIYIYIYISQLSGCLTHKPSTTDRLAKSARTALEKSSCDSSKIEPRGRHHRNGIEHIKFQSNAIAKHHGQRTATCIADRRHTVSFSRVERRPDPPTPTRRSNIFNQGGQATKRLSTLVLTRVVVFFVALYV